MERTFKILERVTELRDCELDKLKAQCDSTVPSVNANLLAAQSLCGKILDQERGAEIEQALESSRQVREKELKSVLSDSKEKCSRIDEAYKQKEQDLRKQYRDFESQLEEKNKK